jgi:hypothetical protein
MSLLSISISCSSSSSRNTFEKYSGVKDRREAMVALVTGRDTVARGAALNLALMQQISNNALHSAVQGTGLDIVNQSMQSARYTRQHLHGEAGITLNFDQYCVFAYGQQQRVGE